tara:strand:+ start:105 stop:347 length:243 start_codon:yes stop_codon:yes gene_type:complete
MMEILYQGNFIIALQGTPLSVHPLTHLIPDNTIIAQAEAALLVQTAQEHNHKQPMQNIITASLKGVGTLVLTRTLLAHQQ